MMTLQASKRTALSKQIDRLVPEPCPAREELRDGVESAIESLGAGFLTTKGNEELRERLRSGDLATQDYYRQLLRVVYRLLILLVAEEKTTANGESLLHPPDTSPEVRDRYASSCSVRRIRLLADGRRGTAHTDLYESLKDLFLKLREGYPPLGIPGMGSFLFSADSTPDLDDVLLANRDILDAIRKLCYTEDASGRGGSIRRPVDFGNLGSKEFGSVYEALLELHPQIDTEAGSFTLGTAAGHERKTTGSYYTPDSLINFLLDSALDPVVNEAIDVADPAEAERKLLNLKVCDPACGSGHFLIAAAERMAVHLARIRTGDDQPNTLDVQHAKRDIIGRCIYGVDLNPMAVELCKVSLWMEALEPGRPLSFLDHHIQCGNSLLGTTPALLQQGIPDDAFKPIEGDVKAVARDLKKQNKKQHKDREQRQEEERQYSAAGSGVDSQSARLLADTWCAVFVWKKDTSDLGKLCPTELNFREFENNPHSMLPLVKFEVRRLAEQYQFLHWHLAFPDVFQLPEEGAAENTQTGWNRGFDVVLGNPPWEKIKLQEKEWFAERSPTIASASTAAQRRKMISELQQSDPQLHAEFLEAKRQAEGEAKFVRGSGRFPLCSRGDVNTFALFAELAKSSIGLFGRVGCVIPTAIVTDETTKFFFQDMMQRGSLVSLYDFENSAQLFPGVHRSYKFCLLTMSGSDTGTESQFVFFAKVPQDISITDKQFTLSNRDLALLNPNTLTCPIFRSRRDAELTKSVHSRLPVLRLDNPTSEHETWDLSFARLFDMTNDSALFRKQDELLADDWELQGNSYIKNGDRMFPVLEGKMVGMWNSRAADIRINADNVQRQQVAERLSAVEFADPARCPIPFLWSPESAARDRTPKDWNKQWFVVFKRVTAATNERTLVGCIIPWTAVSYTLYVVTCTPHNQPFLPALAANLLSFPCDYILRQKTAQPSLPMGVVYESAFVAPSVYSSAPSFCAGVSFLKWLLPRVLELTYTAWDLEAFALDCDYSGPPFRWDEKRRFLLRCELDAAYFHLYLGTPAEWGSDSPKLREMFPTPREAVDYIMETFPIVKRKDLKRTEIKNEQGEVTSRGTYITKDIILEIYDEMATAIGTGQPYQTRLAPPPGPPTTADGRVIPAGEWDKANWPPHVHKTMQTPTK